MMQGFYLTTKELTTIQLLFIITANQQNMSFTKKASHKNLVRIHAASNLFELTLEPLIKKYGMRFTLKLLKSVLVPKELTGEPKAVYFLEPNTISKVRSMVSHARAQDKQNSNLEEKLSAKIELLIEEYIELVTQSGFKITRWNEDFVDKDTGEIITIERKEFFCLYLKQKPA